MLSTRTSLLRRTFPPYTYVCPRICTKAHRKTPLQLSPNKTFTNRKKMRAKAERLCFYHKTETHTLMRLNIRFCLAFSVYHIFLQFTSVFGNNYCQNISFSFCGCSMIQRIGKQKHAGRDFMSGLRVFMADGVSAAGLLRDQAEARQVVGLPTSSSSMPIFKSSARSSRKTRSGQARPRSHLETAWGETPIWTAT